MKRLTLKTTIIATILLCGLTTTLQAKDYTIYPIPQKMTNTSVSLTLGQSVQIVADGTIDQATLNRAKQVLTDHGISVGTNGTPLYLGSIGANGEAEQRMVALSSTAEDNILTAGKYDRHGLAVTAEGIIILGEHTNAVFCGLASLEQMLEQQEDGTLQGVTIYDWADQQNRGLVEGYYGYPYSVDVKKDLMKFMMRFKMNTYMYGAKSDPYHSQYWKDAYPTQISAQQEQNGWLNQDMVRDIAETSEATKVNFIWAIHPGNNFLGSSTVVNDIMSKFTMMHGLGIRQFAVFVDDVSIPSSDSDMKLNADRLTELQKAIETKWNKEGALATDTVRPLHFVPQIYCSSFASSEDQRKRFMSALGNTPSYITIYTTGQGVWTVPNSPHTANMNSELGRDMAWWWNYPCNDNADGQIYTMDMYSNFYDLPSVDGNATMPSSFTHCKGLVANPMQEGEVAKTALFSVADYAWNNSGFDNQKSWEASFEPLISDNETREAYRFLTRYLRWNEPSTVNTLINSYKTGLSKGAPNSQNLNELLTTISDNCAKVESLATSSIESDRLLYNDVRPWLLKLRDDSRVLLKLLAVAQEKNDTKTKWENYLQCLRDIDSLKTSTQYTAYALEGMGNSISVSQRQAQVSQLYLEPFISYMKENAMTGCFTDQTPAAKGTYVTNRSNIVPSVNYTSSTNVTYITAAQRSYAPGEYIGIKLAQTTKLDSIAIADTLFDNHCIMWSANGKQWNRLASAHQAPDTLVRYVVVFNDKAKDESYKLVQKSIQLFMPKRTTIVDCTIPSGNVWENHNKSYMIDGDYSTFTVLNRCQQTNDAYTVDLGEVKTIHDVRIYMGTTNGDYMTNGRVQVSADGEKWYALRVKGVTSNFNYTLDMPQNVKLNDDVTYCDFDGAEKQARYVSLSLKTPNTEKWLRLYEIEVNKRYDDACLTPLCTDAESSALLNAIDGNGSTCTSKNTEGSITYWIQEIADIEELTVFQDPMVCQPNICISEDGETWLDFGTLTDAYQVIDLRTVGNVPATVGVRFTWKGTAPAIYEIVPTFSTIIPAIATGVANVPANSAEQANDNRWYNLQGQRIAQPMQHGIYIRNGKKIIK